MTRVTCPTCQHWTAPANRRGLGTCAKELTPETAKARHWCVFHKEHTYASLARLSHQPVPYLPPAIAALRRPARATAKQVSPGPMSGDSEATPARTAGVPLAGQASLTIATFSEAAATASRTRGVMDGTATEPNRSEATPAPVL